MRYFFLCSIVMFLLGSVSIYAQGTAVNSSGAAADGSAILDVSSTTQGMLIPRMTAAQRTAITSPATGLLVYQTDGVAGLYYNQGTPGAPNWVVPVINTFSILDASSATSFDCTDASVSTWILDANGRNTSGVSFNIDLPSAGSLPAGTILRIVMNSITTAAPTVLLQSSGSTYSAPNFNDADISSSNTSIGTLSLIALMTDGNSRWFRVQ